VNTGKYVRKTLLKHEREREREREKGKADRG
jgi:hypothetical protein